MTMKPINFSQLFQTNDNNEQSSVVPVSDLASLKTQYDTDKNYYTSQLPTICATGALIGSLVTHLALDHNIVLTVVLSLLSFLAMGSFICVLGTLKSNPLGFLFPVLEKRKNHYLAITSQLERLLSQREKQYAILFPLREYIDSIRGKIKKHKVDEFETSYTYITEQFEQKNYSNAIAGIIQFYEYYQACLNLFENQEKKNSFYQGLNEYFEQQRSDATLKHSNQNDSTEIEQESTIDTEKELQKVFTKII